MNLLSVLKAGLPSAAAFGLGWVLCQATRPDQPDATPPTPLASPARPAGAGKSAPPVLSPAAPALVTAAGLTASIYHDAGQDLEAALARLQANKNPSQRKALAMGIFAYVAGHRRPEEALHLALALKGDADRETALTTLVQTWTGNSQALFPSPQGDIVDRSRALFSSKSLPPGVADAWLKAFADHPGRSLVSAAYAASHLTKDTDRLLAMAESFTPWEKQQYMNEVIGGWSQANQEAALQWLRENPNGVSAKARAETLEEWVQWGPDQVSKQLAVTNDSVWRLELLRAQAKHLGGQDTAAAVAWADGLPTAAEQEAAHEAIYTASPRGIGAVLSSDSGFPTIRNLLPDGAAGQAGLLPGDRLVEISGAAGQPVSLYGINLQDAVASLRSDTTDTINIRLLRTAADGQVTEQVLPVTRKQLILKAEPQEAPR
jgi:hypothetical protein